MGQGTKDQPLSDGPSCWKVPEDKVGVRLDVFLRRCLPYLSMHEIRKQIEGKTFWIGERSGRKGDLLFPGDVITFRGPKEFLSEAPSPHMDQEVPVLYEDESILVLDKPAGMPTHGFSGREKSSLANFLLGFRPSVTGVGNSPWEPGLVHRLDRETSGVLIAAKTQEAFECLRRQFRAGEVRKKYWALVWGRTKKSGRIDFPLAHDPTNRSRMIAFPRGGREKRKGKSWNAATEFRRLSCSRGFSFLEVEMKTGVTHQIRVHFQTIGHPLVGDSLYGKGRSGPFELRRHFLHACSVRFLHPKSGSPVIVESPLPAGLREILTTLGLGFEPRSDVLRGRRG